MGAERRDNWFFCVIFLVLFCVYSIGSGFPVYWHPEELGKQGQIVSGMYNFRHPQLLLRLTSVAHFFLASNDDPRSMVLTGRAVSAASAAVAVTLLAIMSFRRYGLVYGLLTAALVGLSPSVCAAAHFLKEDAVLLFGIAAAMLALQAVDLNPSRTNFLLLGLSTGLALSSKYVGAIMLAPMTAMLIFKSSRHSDWTIAFGAAVLAFALINFSGWPDLQTFQRSFLYEFNHVNTSHRGIVWGYTSARSIIDVWQNVSIVVPAFWFAGLAMLFTARRQSPLDWIVFLLPILFLAMLQLSMVKFARYITPAVALLSVAAVWACAELVMRYRSRLVTGAAMGAVAFGIVTTAVMAIEITGDFIDNPRDRMARWIVANLPKDAVIATDFYAAMPNETNKQLDGSRPSLPQKMVSSFDLSYDSATRSIEARRRQGITHLVIASGNYDRFFDRTAAIESPQQAEQKQFYNDLFATLHPIHEELPYIGDPDSLVASRLSLYDIRPR